MARSTLLRKLGNRLRSPANAFARSKPRPCVNCVILRARANCARLWMAFAKRSFVYDLKSKKGRCVSSAPLFTLFNYPDYEITQLLNFPAVVVAKSRQSLCPKNAMLTNLLLHLSPNFRYPALKWLCASQFSPVEAGETAHCSPLPSEA